MVGEEIPVVVNRIEDEFAGKVTYTKAMYFSLDKKKIRVAKTIPLGEGKYLDVTETNEPIGLEIILPRELPASSAGTRFWRDNYSQGKSQGRCKRRT